MKVIVGYDSNFGNTKEIAEIIADELMTKAISVEKIEEGLMADCRYMVLGCPIIGWKPTSKMEAFVDALRKEKVKGLGVVTFDTRVRLFFHGDAAEKLAKKLESLGARILTDPEYFYVGGQKGPLLSGEVEKARRWAKKIKAILEGKNESIRTDFE